MKIKKQFSRVVLVAAFSSLSTIQAMLGNWFWFAGDVIFLAFFMATAVLLVDDK